METSVCLESPPNLDPNGTEIVDEEIGTVRPVHGTMMARSPVEATRLFYDSLKKIFFNFSKNFYCGKIYITLNLPF